MDYKIFFFPIQALVPENYELNYTIVYKIAYS